MSTWFTILRQPVTLAVRAIEPDSMKGKAMGNTWIADLTHFLDENGHIAPETGPARRMAEFFVAIVAMVSRPELVIPAEYQVRCRRRPGRKPCPGMVEVDLDPETEDVVWWCPVCGDNGYIQNWKGTGWDLSDSGNALH